MFLSLRLWARGFRLGLKRPGRTRRALFTAALFVAWSALRALVMVGRALDHVFSPGFRRQSIEAPVYIVGSPRSGTTFLHGLLALDAERFTSLRLYETLLPSIVLCRLVTGLAALDRALGRPVGRLAAAIDRRAFAGWDDVHATSLTRHEEPEGIWILKMLTPAAFLLFPFFDELPELASLENVRSDRARRSAVRFYVGSLKRHLYLQSRRRGERTLLVKTVLFPSRIEAVMEAIPDIRFVHLVRDPRRFVPSALSMLTMPWKVHSPRMVGATPESRRFAEVFIDGVRRYARAREATPPARWLSIDFDYFISGPGETVGRIYNHFGMDLDEEFRTRVRAAAEVAQGRRSVHRYTLEEFGLSAGELEAALPDVIAGIAPRASEAT